MTSRRFRLGVAGVGTFVGVVAAWTLWGGPRQTKQDSINQKDRVLQELAAEIGQLKRRVRAAEQRGREHQGDSPEVVAQRARNLPERAADDLFEEPNGDPASTLNDHDDDTIARDRDRSRKRIQLLSDLHAQEDRDSAWAREIEGKISLTIESFRSRASVSFRLVTGDCRSTMCRVEASAPRAEAEKLPPVLAKIGLRTFGAADVDSDGSIRWTIFMERPGHPLAKVTE